MNLRDALLTSLKDLPGQRSFHVHVLVSPPRKNTSLFPYATTKTRIYRQEILVLLSEQSTSNEPRVLVSAIEANLYHIPSTSTAILYISKVDSTGQGARPSPTPELVKAFIKFHADRTTRPSSATHLWVHLFARAQPQYLFPNSGEFKGKKPLNDIKLCAWWKKTYTSVAKDWMLDGLGTKHTERPDPRLFFVLPGMNRLEALQSLGELSTIGSTSNNDGVKWTYGHPYSQSDIPLPYVGKHTAETETRQEYNLGHYIPSFDDDPMARFMDEIACITQSDGIRSPPSKKRKKLAKQQGEIPESDDEGDKRKGKGKGHDVEGELGVVSVDEFWERMGFRQECVAGAVTGFFVAIYSSPPSQHIDSDVPKHQEGQVSHHIVNRVISSLMTGNEFSTSERALRATEILEGAIRGLCGGGTKQLNSSSASKSTGCSEDVPATQIPQHVADKVIANSASRGSSPSRQVLAPLTPPPPPLSPPRTPTRVQSNAKRHQEDEDDDDEGLAELDKQPSSSGTDIYNAYIYGTINIDNPILAKTDIPSAVSADGRAAVSSVSNTGGQDKPTTSQPAVTVLSVRKRAKPLKK